jgi:aspartate ammonia-lyase
MVRKQYYGEQTEQALQNFPFPHRGVYSELIIAVAEVKKACAHANYTAKDLNKDIAQAISDAADEVIDGKFADQFPTAGLQGGAGTSINMNVNEVLAARAEELLHQRGIPKSVHPNDHVNRSQSTNDVNPSALRIASIRLVDELLEVVDRLADAMEQKAQSWKKVKKLGRTHMQDAVPTTLGAEFAAYAAIVRRDRKRIAQAKENLFELNLGGTAIGNRINASSGYVDAVYPALSKITGMELKPADNMMAFTSGNGDICHLSATVTVLVNSLSKIATDIRFMASGPIGGIGEVRLKALQPGSSIMPGKINPVMPESLNQLYYFITGKNMTVHQSAEGAHLELGVMFPVMADAILTMLKLTASVLDTFTHRCIVPMEANEERCAELLERSTAYATLLTPVLGYDIVSKAVKESVQRGISIREVIMEKGLMTEDEFEDATTL